MKFQQGIRGKKILAAAVAAASCGAVAEQPVVLEEVIVTAGFREQSVLDIPYNISSVDGDLLAASQMIDTTEMIRNFAGVSLVDRGFRNSGVTNGIMIRGVNVETSASGDVALSTVPTVSTYVNNTPMYANFMLKDIERVEVLRGPQGTLYGSGSLGGTVRYIMSEPDTEVFAAKVGGTYSQTEGSDGHNWSADAMLNIPLGETLAARFYVSKVDAAGITDYVNIYALDDQGAPVAAGGDVLAGAPVYTSKDDADTVDIDFIRGALKFQPNDRFKALLTYQQQSDDVGGRRQETPGTDGFGNPYDDYENGSIQLEPSSRDVNMTSLEMEVDMGFASIVSSTSVYEHEGDSVSENTGFYAQLGWLSAYYYNMPRPMASAKRSFEDEAFVQELRLVSNGDGAFDYVVGLYYMNQDLSATQDSFLPGYTDYTTALFGFQITTGTDQDWAYERDENFKDMAAYGELTWHMSDTWHLTVGARYFDNEFTNETFIALPMYDENNGRQSSFKFDDSGTLFKANLAWDASDTTMVYATVSEGYRRGGSNAVPVEGNFGEPNGEVFESYDPDSVINYELGVKGGTDRWQYSASLFMVDWEDIQVNSATAIYGYFVAFNGDEARSQGLELEFTGQLSDNWRINGGYAYVDAELTEDLISPQFGGTIAESGRRLPGSPEHSVSASLEHSMTLSNGLMLINRVNGYYQTETLNTITEGSSLDVEFDSFGLWNYVGTLAGDSWDVSLYVKNIGNEKGVTGALTEAYMGSEPSENYYGNGAKDYITLPRTIGAAFNYHF